MKVGIIPHKKVVIDENLYPREEVNEEVVKEYAKAMDNNEVFPPIRLGQIKGKGPMILVDGRHRLEANEFRGENYIQFELKINYPTKEDLFLDAIRSNLKHGVRMNEKDKQKVAIRLKDMKIEIGEISKLLRIPSTKLEKDITYAYKKVVFQNEVKNGKIKEIRDKTKKGEKIKLVDDEEMKKAEEKNKANWQRERLKEITKYLESEEFEIKNKLIIRYLKRISGIIKATLVKLEV